jgi:two-component system nitrogen regulation response regulator NtrX
VDVRVVCATHRNLEEQVKAGAFRQDLYHRIYVFPIVLPPLRERKDDIAALVEHFSGVISEINGWKPKAFTAEAIHILTQHAWPGNVRELRNAVERLLLLSDGEVDNATVRDVLPQAGEKSRPSGTLAVRMDAYERETIQAELARAHNNMTEAARSLGLERSHLYKKCTQLGIDVKGLRRAEE